MVCSPVRELVDYLLVQADKPWYNYYIFVLTFALKCNSLVLQCGLHPTDSDGMVKSLDPEQPSNLGLHCFF